MDARRVGGKLRFGELVVDLFCEALLDSCRMAAGDRPDLQAERCKRSNPAAEAFQRRISASARKDLHR